MRLSPAMLAAFGLALAAPANALSVRGGPSAGLMQQPTSNYYHAVYGGYLELATEKDRFLVRGSYSERPRFEAGGFVDQEMGVFGTIGTQVVGTASRGLFAFFGAGRMAGYIRTADDVKPTQRRGYSLPGPTAILEYGWRWKKLSVALNHQTFVGYVDREELETRVAWPFNFFHVQIGVGW